MSTLLALAVPESGVALLSRDGSSELIRWFNRTIKQLLYLLKSEHSALLEKSMDTNSFPSVYPL